MKLGVIVPYRKRPTHLRKFQESIKEYTRVKTTWFNASQKPMSDPFTMG